MSDEQTRAGRTGDGPGGDEQVLAAPEQGQSGLVIEGENIAITGGGGTVLTAGQNMSVQQGGGAVLVAGHNMTISQGGGWLLVAGGRTDVRESFIGVLISREAPVLDANTRVLMTVPMALAAGAALGGAFALLSGLLHRRA